MVAKVADEVKIVMRTWSSKKLELPPQRREEPAMGKLYALSYSWYKSLVPRLSVPHNRTSLPSAPGACWPPPCSLAWVLPVTALLRCCPRTIILPEVCR